MHLKIEERYKKDKNFKKDVMEIKTIRNSI
jgi:hypothetical protein